MQNVNDIAAATIDEAAVLAAINRLRRIEFRHSMGQAGSRAALMREYLRRSALVGEAIGRPDIKLWFDAAAALSFALPLPGIETRLLPGHTLLNDGSYYPGPGIGAKRTPQTRSPTPLPLDWQTLDALDDAWNQRSEARRSSV